MTFRDLVPESLRRYVPRFVKEMYHRQALTPFQRDIERFRQDGTRFIPPLLSFPPMVMIDTTTRCNLACSHCPNSVLSGEKGFWGDLESDLYFKIIDEIAEESPGTLVRPFDGGEPLLRKDLPELIGYAKQKGIHRVSITTNGTILNENVRRKLIHSGLDHMEVSIDAATSGTYQKIRRSPLYDKVVENTLAYIEESKAFDPRREVSVSFVLQTENRLELDAFREFWRPRADQVDIREYHQHNNLMDEGGRVGRKNLRFRHPCPYLWNRIIVHHDGRVRFCEGDWRAEHVLGNVREQTLKEIWQGELYRRLRQQHIDGTFEHPFCGPCTDWREILWPGLEKTS